MEEKFRYSFDDSTKILFKYYFGQITIEDIYSSWDYAISKNLIPKETKGFILDYREASFNFKVREYYKIAEYYQKHLEIFGGFKIAIISQTPQDVVIPTLVETKDDGYLSRPFYTVEAAVLWVLS
jgi:hypothetical protein